MREVTRMTYRFHVNRYRASNLLHGKITAISNNSAWRCFFFAAFVIVKSDATLTRCYINFRQTVVTDEKTYGYSSA